MGEDSTSTTADTVKQSRPYFLQLVLRQCFQKTPNIDKNKKACSLKLCFTRSRPSLIWLKSFLLVLYHVLVETIFLSSMYYVEASANIYFVRADGVQELQNL